MQYRGLVVLSMGAALWVAARIAGSPGLEIVGIGLALLPLVAAGYGRMGRGRLRAQRHLTSTIAAPGQRITVDVTINNQSAAPTSLLLLQDHVPSGLGQPARLVLTGIPARNDQDVSYSLTPKQRGRYEVGPLTIDVSDPFALTRRRVIFPHLDSLVVTPRVEDLPGGLPAPTGTGAGASPSQHLFRTGEEFYTMREYQQGDDLRRIHWPSVARSGKLMIRQDELARRSSVTIFLDTRTTALGRSHSPAFEKAVSAAASIGVLLARSGFTLRLGTTELAPFSVGEEAFLETLAGVTDVPAHALRIERLRQAAAGDSTLVVVTAPPLPAEVAAITRVGTAYGPKIAVLVYPADPSKFPPASQSQLEGRASVARLSLARAGWKVYVLTPEANLRDAWIALRNPLPAASGS